MDEPFDDLPDVRDGLTRRERVVLWVLSRAQAEKKGRSVPTAMLYGRVVEHVDMTEQELVAILVRLGAREASRRDDERARMRNDAARKGRPR